MPTTRLTQDPPLPRMAGAQPFLQRITLYDGREAIGSAVWYLPAGRDGVVQLIELTVPAARHRQGHAGTILTQVLTSAKALCALKKIPLRRVWFAIEQKTQVLGRSFLTRHGFHHTSTIPELLRKQDVLIYVKSFD
jgi:hypothetical protein